MTTNEASLMDIEQSSVIDSDAAALVMRIMQQNAKDAAFTSNALMHGYRTSQLKAEATINAIRWNVMQLFAAGYQPSESSIMEAIWPSAEQVEEFMEENSRD